MKDAYGTEIEVGDLVVMNYSGHLAKGIVKKAEETWHFGSKMKGKKIEVEYIKPPQQNQGFKTSLECREDGTIVKCNQVIVIPNGRYKDIKLIEYPQLQSYGDFEPMKATLASVSTEEEFRPTTYTPASLIRDFRDKYGCGIEQARKALQMAGNDEEKALRILRGQK